MNRAQTQRLLWRSAFFVLFVLAPPLDIFRFDLTQNHFILFGMPWTLGLDAFINGEIGPTQAALNLILRGFLPVLLVGGTLLWTAWRYGRLYCGWLCPHFSVVERINGYMRRASGKPSLWEARPLPARQPDGSQLPRSPRYWFVTVLAAAGFALLWAVVLLTYLLPPAEIWGNLFSMQLTRNQSLFIGVATALLVIEFTLARHLFCRFGCRYAFVENQAQMDIRNVVIGQQGRDMQVDIDACV